MAITNGETGDESDGSMPSLQTVSDSSEESEGSDYGDDDDDDDDDSEEESDDDYDEEDEDQLKDMMREAWDTATATDFFSYNADPQEFDAMAEDRKGNPFIKLLGSLRGMCVLAVRKLRLTRFRRAYVFF